MRLPPHVQDDAPRIPTQGLDAVIRRSLWEYIDDTRSHYGTTIFLTTHYIDEAENVDTVCVINQGKIAACSSPENIKRSLITVLRIHEPSLEDAYVEFLNRTRRDAA